MEEPRPLAPGPWCPAAAAAPARCSLLNCCPAPAHSARCHDRAKRQSPAITCSTPQHHVPLSSEGFGEGQWARRIRWSWSWSRRALPPPMHLHPHPHLRLRLRLLLPCSALSVAEPVACRCIVEVLVVIALINAVDVDSEGATI